MPVNLKSKKQLVSRKLQEGVFEELRNGKIDRPRLSRKALSKAEIESLARGYSTCTSELRSDRKSVV